MEYIKDEIPLTDVVIPSAHNAGSYGMGKPACCQDGDFYKQFCYGVRHYCIRLDTDRRGVIRQAHGMFKGARFEDSLCDLQKALAENESEFFIFDIREYYPQPLIGNLSLYFRADADEVNRLLEKYIEPSRYAFTDFTDITKVTMGDLRKSGKRYILINNTARYDNSVECPLFFPWDKDIYGMHAEKFVKNIPQYFEKSKTYKKGLFWFQTQQTPNIGTEIGMKRPRKLDRDVRKYFYRIIDSIVENEEYLKNANIISGDFMTEDYMKVRSILLLNVLKGTVKEERASEYLQGLWK